MSSSNNITVHDLAKSYAEMLLPSPVNDRDVAAHELQIEHKAYDIQVDVFNLSTVGLIAAFVLPIFGIIGASTALFFAVTFFVVRYLVEHSLMRSEPPADLSYPDDWEKVHTVVLRQVLFANKIPTQPHSV